MPGNLRTCRVLLCLCSLAAVAEPAGVWLDVPFVKQERNGCGAASIAMVMQYWLRQQGRASEAGSDAASIERALYSPKAGGIYASKLVDYFERHGFRTFAFAGQWQDLKLHLEKGRPLIAALQPNSRAPLHYVVVVGLDSQQSLVLVNDPAERKLLRHDRARFEKEWKGAGNWILLAMPREGSPSVR